MKGNRDNWNRSTWNEINQSFYHKSSKQYWNKLINIAMEHDKLSNELIKIETDQLEMKWINSFVTSKVNNIEMKQDTLG